MICLWPEISSLRMSEYQQISLPLLSDRPLQANNEILMQVININTALTHQLIEVNKKHCDEMLSLRKQHYDELIQLKDESARLLIEAKSKERMAAEDQSKVGKGVSKDEKTSVGYENEPKKHPIHISHDAFSRVQALNSELREENQKLKQELQELQEKYKKLAELNKSLVDEHVKTISRLKTQITELQTQRDEGKALKSEHEKQLKTKGHLNTGASQHHLLSKAKMLQPSSLPQVACLL